jgi:outer membrane protein, heavy metal efflux system
MGRRFSKWSCVMALAIVTQETPGEAAAQEAPTLRDVLGVALAKNPDILAAHLAVDSASAEQRIARALPNPTVTGVPNTPYQYTLSLPADLGPARIFRTRATGAGRAAAERDLENVVRLVTFSVRQAFYDLLLVGDQRNVAEEERDIFRQLLAADSIRLKSGDIPPRNITKSVVELTRADAALASAEARVRQARLALQELMGVTHPDTGFRVSGSLVFRPLPIPLDSLQATARQQRPDLAAVHERARQSRALQALAASALLPTPMVTLAWQPDGPFETSSVWTLGGAHHLSLGIGVTLPLFNWFGGERQRARAAAATADLEVARAETAVETEVVAASDAFQAARTLATRYQDGLLEAAARALTEARYGYGAGALSLLDLLDAVRTYAETRSDAAAALHEYWVSAAALARTVGRELLPE